MTTWASTHQRIGVLLVLRQGYAPCRLAPAEGASMRWYPLFLRHGHPFSAFPTASSTSSTVIWPSPLASPATQLEAGDVSRAMFTMVMRSGTVTTPML